MAQPIHVGIYARQNRHADSPKAVSEHVAACHKHVQRIYPDCSVTVYDSDQCYLKQKGARSSFLQMLEDVRAHKISVVCCYNLGHFSPFGKDIVDVLSAVEQCGATFVCVDPGIISTNPVHRAHLLMLKLHLQGISDSLEDWRAKVVAEQKMWREQHGRPRD